MTITHLHFLLALDENKSIRIGDTHEMYMDARTRVCDFARLRVFVRP